MNEKDIPKLEQRLERGDVPLSELQSDEIDAVICKDVAALFHMLGEKNKQRQIAELSTAVNRINKIAHSSRDPGQILQSVISEGCRALGSETAALSLRESGVWKVHYVYGMPNDYIDTVISDDEERHAVLALKTRQPVAISDAFEDDRCNREYLRRHNIRAVLAVPLITGDHPAGVIFLNYHTAPHHFNEQEINFSRQIAATASTACHNAQLFAQISEAAAALRKNEQQLQQTMKAGRIFTCEWEPATDTMHRSVNCAEILGINPTTCTRDTGENYCRRIHDDDKARFTKLTRNLTPVAPTYETRYRVARDDGRYVWIEESGQAEFDEAGNMTRVRSLASDITERMEALTREKEVSATIAAAQSAIEIVDAMGEGIVLFRLDGTVTAVNPAIEKFTLRDRSEFLGHNIRSLLPQFLEGTNLTEMTHALDEAMRGRAQKLKPVVLKRETMPPVTVSPSIAIITSSAGTPVSAVLTLKDVTELCQQSELLKQIFDNTHMQMVYLDQNLNIVRVNRAYADYNRRNSDFFHGKNYLEICTHQKIKTEFQQALQEDEFFSATEKPFASPHRPGKTTYWDYSLRPMHDKTGKREGFLLCLLDVTERVESRRQLVASEQKYQELVENANSIIMRITPDQRITFFNEYAQRFFGYSGDEIIGRSVLGTIMPETDSQGRNLRKMMEDIAAAPETHKSNENENMRKDGQRVQIYWSNRALRDEKGAVKELLCVGSDISERWHLQHEAEAYRKRLQQLANRLITHEEQARRRIATDIHDTVVQTLSLANIRLGGVLAALDKAGLPEQREKVAEIRNLLDQGTTECRGLMEALVPSLLYESGLAAALRYFAERQVARTEGTRINVETADQQIAINDALRGMLFQSARELIMNAIKYAGPCDIRISLSFPDEYIELKVQDNGRGFNPGDINGRAHDKNGGYGIFNIRERLRNMGGQLNIDTMPGKGTTATIRVPKSPTS